MKNLTIAIIGLILSTNLSALSPSSTTTLASVLEKSSAEKKNIFVSFKADWCIQCYKMDDMIATSGNIQETLTNYIELKVDIEDSAMDEWNNKYESHCLPNLLILDKTGKILVGHSGVVSEEELMKSLTAYADVDTKVAQREANKMIATRTVKKAPVKRMMNNTAIVSAPELWTITVGSFSVENNAFKHKQKVEGLTGQELFMSLNHKNLYQVNVGRFATKEEAQNHIKEFSKQGLDYYFRKI